VVEKFIWRLGDTGQQIGDGWPDIRKGESMAKNAAMSVFEAQEKASTTETKSKYERKSQI